MLARTKSLRRIGAWAVIAIAAGLGAACVQEAPTSTDTQVAADSDDVDDDLEATEGPLQPLTVGSTWTYRVQEEGEEYTKVVTVEAEEQVGGDGPNSDVSALKVVTTEGGQVESIKWQAVDGGRVVRYREQEFSKKTGEANADTHWDPARLVIDESSRTTSENASWVESYEETKAEDGVSETSTEKDTWYVDAIDAAITVPAGTFRAIVVQRMGKSKAKTFWFVPGIGKVKEEGDVLEELVSYEVAK